MTARPPTCPSCGAPATGQERACDFCHAPVATVRCSSCFHMNSPDFLHCAGCGRMLGLEPVPETSALPCPRCEGPLAAFAGTAGKLYDCARCGGQLVEHGLLRDLVERTEICGGLITRVTARAARPGDTVRYLPCPVCRTLMNRTNFGVHSGVIVDVCAHHGIWFDAGELPRVLDFVESGGLQRARRRQLEELARQKQSVRTDRVRSGIEAALAGSSLDRDAALAHGFHPTDPTITHSTPAAWEIGLWDDARQAAHEVAREMFAGLTNLLRGKR